MHSTFFSKATAIFSYEGIQLRFATENDFKFLSFKKKGEKKEKN